MEFAVAKDSLTRFVGLPFLAGFLDLGPVLRRRVRVQQRSRGCRDDEMLLTLILALSTGGGHLSSVDTLAADTAACRAAGLCAVLGSGRLGEFLTRLSDQALAGLQECARVGIQIVSCDSDQIVPATRLVPFSRTFVGQLGRGVEPRSLSRWLGRP